MAISQKLRAALSILCFGAAAGAAQPVAPVKAPPPEPPLKTELAGEFCKSTDAITTYNILGYLEAEDAKTKRTFGFIIYKKDLLTRTEFQIGIGSNHAAPLLLTSTKLTEIAKTAHLSGQKDFTAGEPVKKNDADPPQITYRFIQSEGTPVAIEVSMVPRTAEGKDKKPAVTRVPWPKTLALPLGGQTSLQIPAPVFLKQSLIKKYLRSDSPRYKRKKAGNLEAYDHILSKFYAFIVFTEQDTVTGDEWLRVGSNMVAGITITAERAQREAAEAAKAKKAFVSLGAPLASTDGDPRHIEYRLYQTKGKPSSFEIYAITRGRTGEAKPPKTFKMDWPLKPVKKTVPKVPVTKKQSPAPKTK